MMLKRTEGNWLRRPELRFVLDSLLWIQLVGMIHAFVWDAKMPLYLPEYRSEFYSSITYSFWGWMLVLVLIPFSRWRRGDWKHLFRNLGIAFLVTLVSFFYYELFLIGDKASQCQFTETLADSTLWKCWYDGSESGLYEVQNGEITMELYEVRR